MTSGSSGQHEHSEKQLGKRPSSLVPRHMLSSSQSRPLPGFLQSLNCLGRPSCVNQCSNWTFVPNHDF